MKKFIPCLFIALLSACHIAFNNTNDDPAGGQKPIVTTQFGEQSVRLFQGEYVVEFKAGMSEQERLDALQLTADLPVMKLTRLYSQGRLALVTGNVTDEETHKKVMAALRAKAEILAVEPNYVVETQSQNRLPI